MPVSGKTVGLAHDVRGTGSGATRRVPSSARVESVTGKGVISSRVKDYSNDRYFVEKAEVARAVIEKIGLPKKKK